MEHFAILITRSLKPEYCTSEMWRLIMSLSSQEKQLREQFFKKFVETAISVQPGEDHEVTLEALLHASRMLTEHLEKELQEVRQEQTE